MLESPPVRGARIETWIDAAVKAAIDRRVAPRAGARIETNDRWLNVTNHVVEVAPPCGGAD